MLVVTEVVEADVVLDSEVVPGEVVVAGSLVVVVDGLPTGEP